MALEREAKTLAMASEKKQKLVVIMGPTGSGKSKLSIDLASHFPMEVINADSMQVYGGLDVLTNKLATSEQKGVRHHLLGTVNPKEEFTAKDFRDSAIPIIEEILCRNNLPVIVGGTSYYIQALISPFLLDETTDEIDDASSSGESEPSCNEETCDCYDRLASIDPVAANRTHPNNHRKINQYLSLYARSGTLASDLLQGDAAQNWGRVDNLRYDCCFICMESSLPVIDNHVDQRVDCMVSSGLLDEVRDIFSPDANYTRGLLQAIGVREFESFLGSEEEESSRETMLREAIEKVKLNTRRLVRKQRRMAFRLQNLFGWNIHFVDATESISSKSDVIWAEEVVEPAAKIIRASLDQDSNNAPNCNGTRILERDLWTQFTCEACSNKVLRGAYEWEQHKQGRCHRKRISKLRKRSLGFFSTKLPQD